jgi:hypothetical protein
MNVSWDDLDRVREPGEFPFRDGMIAVTFAEIATWQQHPEALFQLMRIHPVETTPRYLLGRRVEAASRDELLFYRSSNGDTWSLSKDAAAGTRTVIHRPNPQSGGRVSHRAIEEFLTEGANSPEHQALRSWLDSDVDLFTLLIVYDIHPRSGPVSERVIKEIQSLGEWWHHLETVWIVRSGKTSTEIRDLLGPLLGFDDQLLVIDISGNAVGWAGVNEAGSQWLAENI